MNHQDNVQLSPGYHPAVVPLPAVHSQAAGQLYIVSRHFQYTSEPALLAAVLAGGYLTAVGQVGAQLIAVGLFGVQKEAVDDQAVVHMIFLFHSEVGGCHRTGKEKLLVV